MTKDEAIATLEAIKQFGMGKWIFDKEEIEAFDMAIEALQAKTDGDLISRADAIEAVENLQTEQWIDSDIDYNNGLQSAIAEIKAFPSADRQTELLKDGTLKVNVNNGAEVNRVLVWGDDGCGGLYYADDRPSGEWIKQSEDLKISDYRCSVCGHYQDDKTDYCPNCGADMRGEEDA